MKTKTLYITAVLFLVLPPLFWGCSAERNNINDPDSPNYQIGVTLKLGDGTELKEGTTITGHEPITIAFSDEMTSCSVSGSMGNAMAAGNLDWEDTKTYTITPGVGNVYPEGSGQVLGLKCTSVEGKELDNSYTFVTENAVYVSSGLNTINPGDPSNDGTKTSPLSVIQTGVNLADDLYDTARVNVAEGDYNVACALSPSAVYAVEMKEGISLYGGYSENFNNYNSSTYISKITDTSTSGTGSSEFNPISAIYCDSTITNNTVIDGFTITIGKDNGTHSAIYCNGGSPTIKNNIIQGQDLANASLLSHGILFSSSSAIIQNNTIDPGTSTVNSTGLYCVSTSTLTIENNTLSGGVGDSSYVIRTEGGSDAIISYNNITGGDWSTEGISIRVYNSAPTITDNTFNILSTLKWETYSITEENGTSDPLSVKRNNFNYDGYWYLDENTTTIDKNNPGTFVTTGDGNESLFDSGSWNNSSSYIP